MPTKETKTKTTKAKTPTKKATTKKAPTKKKVGRPSKYTQEIADELCSELAQGKSLRTVCKSPDMPSTVAVFSWFRTNEEFLNQYTRAKEESADALSDEMIDIADDANNDYMENIGKDGQSEGYKLNGDHVRRSHLRIETRKWLASKLKPKRYGNNVSVAVKESKEFSKENLAELEEYLKGHGIDPTKL